MSWAVQGTCQSVLRVVQRQSAPRLLRSPLQRQVSSSATSLRPSLLASIASKRNDPATTRVPCNIIPNDSLRPRSRAYSATPRRAKTSTIEGTIESGAADTATPATSTTASPSTASASDTPDPFTTAVPSSTSPSASTSTSTASAGSGSGSSLGSTPPLPTPEHLNAAEAAIFTKLAAALEPVKLEVQDISGGCGSMYGIEIVSARFQGLSVLKQQRLVNGVLGEEIKGWHGVQLKTRVP